jgi:hypothetical protein
MQLSVMDETGCLVAAAETDARSAESLRRSGFAHVVGTFKPGPGFPRIREMLGVFNQTYEYGTVADASAVHELIDALGLYALDTEGNKYHVYNVYFAQGALFAASRAQA